MTELIPIFPTAEENTGLLKSIAGLTDIHTLGFEVLLPFRRVCRRWSDRRKRIDDSLFKGYAFWSCSLPAA